MALDLDVETVDCFMRGYNTLEITSSLGIKHGHWRSLRTTQRRLKRLGLNSKGHESPFHTIVEAVEHELQETCRSLGVGQIWKRLRTKHLLFVKRQTVRDIVRALCPGRLEAMKKGKLERRKYKVLGPNHIWHIDGNDKLKQYGLCVSGGIDGWSRNLMWLHVARTNKDPKLICQYYLEAVQQHGIVPLCVRLDRGTENTDLSDVHTLLRSAHNDDWVPSSVLFGSSNHNQRIERWWGYLRIAVLPTYLDYFKDLVSVGILDTSNELHIECVRFCFTENLERELQAHLETWNTHRVRKMRDVDCPAGVPDFLFHHPESENKTDQGKAVDPIMIEDLKFLHNYQLPRYGSSDDFAEWAMEAMLDNGWALPGTFQDARELFAHLIMLIYAAQV